MSDLPIKTIIFFVASAGILKVSWRSLHDPHSHGFYRFFAFETVIALVLFNTERWFEDPFSLRQIASWFLLTLSLLLVLYAFFTLQKVGKPKTDFEDTTVLVSSGPFAVIRHPMYSTLLIGGVGVLLKDISVPSGLLFLISATFIFATAKVEEAENLRKFGDQYGEYMKRTRMFIPFLV